MVSVLDSRSNSPGSSAGQGHCVVLLGRTLNYHIASLHPGVNGYWCIVRAPAMDKHPIQGSSYTSSRFMLLKPELAPT